MHALIEQYKSHTTVITQFVRSITVASIMLLLPRFGRDFIPTEEDVVIRAYQVMSVPRVSTHYEKNTEDYR